MQYSTSGAITLVCSYTEAHHVFSVLLTGDAEKCHDNFAQRVRIYGETKKKISEHFPLKSWLDKSFSKNNF